jgi:hypothetical protein
VSVRGNLRFIIPLVVLLAVAIYVQASAPRRIDWSESYTRHHKIPYGAYILHELLGETFADDVRSVDVAVYNVLMLDDSSASYVFINDVISLDEYDREALLEFVADGNTAFIAARAIDVDLAEALDVELEADDLITLEQERNFEISDTVFMNLSASGLRASADYPVRVGRYGGRWLDSYDTARTTILGTDRSGRANLARIAYGDGQVIFSTVPVAFTNFNLISGDNADYAFGALSYLPPGPILWDEHYKSGRIENRSPLRYVMQQAALKWALLLSIAGVALFVIVHARRRQRAIPVVKPPTNSTLAFTETIGRLYLQHADHRDIARKKLSYFQEHLRARLGLRIEEIDGDFYRRVAERSGVPEDLVRSIFGRMQYMNRSSDFVEDDLRGLNRDLETFYSNSKR